MTRTEDRLIAALESAAAAVRLEESRPLAEPARRRQGRLFPQRGRLAARHRRAWLAAVVPAAAAIAVAAFVVALNSHGTSPRSVLAAAYIGGSEPRVPAFFVDAGSTGLYDQKLRVVSLTTGAVTATEHAPAGTSEITFLGEQPQTGNFVAAFTGKDAGRVLLYRFAVTGTGQMTPLTRINGIMLRQQGATLTPLALSPDGSRLALSWTAGSSPAPNGTVDAKIILLDLGNGTRQVWNDTLTDRRHFPQITTAAWTPKGQALVFASHICDVDGASPCFWQFRQLTTTGKLHAGPVLLHQNGMSSEIQAPAISSDGGSVVEVRPAASHDDGASLVRVSLANGRQTVLSRLPAPGRYQAGANEGNFLFVGQQLHPGNNWRLFGWVNDAGFHSLHLPPAS